MDALVRSRSALMSGAFGQKPIGECDRWSEWIGVVRIGAEMIQ
jgi:hypothetical protein